MKICAILFLASALSVFAAEPAVKTSVLESNILCVRVSRVPENFAEQLRAATPTNRICGTILDLRFADGTVAAAADYFAREKSPLVVLVNSETRGVAATLAAQLRAATSAIVIGSTNALGNISPDIAVSVSADDEKKFQEHPYASPVTNSPAAFSGTNNLFAFVDHTSEAELVSKRIKDGDEPGDSTTPRAEPAQPVIRDPALARAVDLLKALAVLHKSRG